MSKPKPQRSNFDLICGMILGGLVVGVLSPIVSKNFGNEGPAGKKSLRARAPVTHHMKSVSQRKDKESSKANSKVIASANAEPARIAEKIAETKPETVAPTPVAAKTVVVKTVAVKSKTVKQERPKSRVKKLEKPRKTIKAAKVSMIPRTYTENLEEISNSASAQTIAAKTNRALTSTGIPASSGSQTILTIANAQYSKVQLDNCSQRCLIKSTDTKGKVVNAIISGPAFAEVLLNHQGTINITGVKRVIKNHELFMVQNITFNLPPKSQTAQAPRPMQSAPDSSSEPAWEDLSEDIKIR